MIWIILGSLAVCIISAGVLFYYLIRDEKLKAKTQVEDRAHIEELERQLTEKTNEQDKVLGQLKNGFNSKIEDLNAQALALKEELSLSKDALEKEKLTNALLEKKSQELKVQLEKSEKGSSMSTQMYEGLKAQYTEVDVEIEKLRQELVEKNLSLESEKALHEALQEKYDLLLSSKDKDKKK